jgi:type I restriction enzyme S subunit
MVDDYWQTTTLAEVCSYLNRGIAPSYIEDGGIQVLNQKCVRNETVSFVLSRRNDDKKKLVPKEKLLQPHDILVNSTGAGTLGRVSQIKRISEPTTVDSHITIVRPNSLLVHPIFLGFALRKLQPEIEAMAEGSTGQTELSRTRLGALEIELPSLAEQKSIAATLGALDDKIDLNRRMNTTLEAQARALFQSWFVDFSPVRAKFDGRKPASLDAATAALFPASFQKSRIGQIPKGWTVETFGDHITAARGLSYKGEGLRDDGTGLPMHNLNSVYEGGGYKHEGIKFYAGEFREKHLVQPGDMIVTNTEQGFDHLLIGHAAIVPERHGAKGLFSHHIYRVRPKPGSPFTPHYLVQLFNNPRWHYWISGFSNGTTINMLPPDALEMPLLVVPPAELIKKFSAFAESVHAQVEKNITESHTLAKLRDTLLPKLLSGELSAVKIEEAARA